MISFALPGEPEFLDMSYHIPAIALDALIELTSLFLHFFNNSLWATEF